MPKHSHWRRVHLVLAVLSLVSFLVAACGGGNGGSSGGATTTTISAVCADAAALEASVTNLKQLDIAKVGTNGLKAALQDTQAKLQAFAASAAAQWQPQIAGLQSSLNNLQSAAAGLGQQPSRAAVQSVESAISGVQNAWAALKQKIGGTCPSLS